MKKVIIIGCPGSGKSTFARKLNKVTNLPLYYLDMMYWNEDRTIVEKNVFLNRLDDAMSNSEWIIDGNYGSTMEYRMSKCDTVFFLDYALDVCLEGIESRKGKPREDMPWFETDNTDEEFITYIKNFTNDSRPKIISLLKKYSNKNIFIFHSRKESEDFLENYCKGEIFI